MNRYSEKTHKSKNESQVETTTPKQIGIPSIFQVEDLRPETTVQRQLQEMANNSPQVNKLNSIQEMSNKKPVIQLMDRINTDNVDQAGPEGGEAGEEGEVAEADNPLAQFVEINAGFDEGGLRYPVETVQGWLDEAQGDLVRISAILVGHQVFNEANHRTFAQYASLHSQASFDAIMEWINGSQDKYGLPFDILANYILDGDIRGFRAELDLGELLG